MKPTKRQVFVAARIAAVVGLLAAFVGYHECRTPEPQQQGFVSAGGGFVPPTGFPGTVPVIRNTGPLTESSIIRPTGVSGTLDNWAPTGITTARTIYVTLSGDAALSSIAAGQADGRQLRLCSAAASGAFKLTVGHESAGTAANQIRNPSQVAVVVPAGGCLDLAYSAATVNRWIDKPGVGAYLQASNTLLSDPSGTLAPGRYYAMPNTGNGVGTSALLGNGSFRCTMVYLRNQITITRMEAGITVVGDANSKLHLGVYADDGTGRPGALVLDPGTINGDSATDQEITGLSTIVGPGNYCFGAAVQGVTVTQPTVRTITNAGIAPINTELGTTMPASSATAWSFIMNGVTSTLPGSFTLSSVGTSAPRIIIKT